MDKPKEYLTYVYEHGTFWREGDKIHVKCIAPRLRLPSGIVYDVSDAAGTLERREQVFYFVARVLDWRGWRKALNAGIEASFE